MPTIYHYLSADEHPDECEGFIYHTCDDIDNCPICGSLSSTNFYLAVGESGHGKAVIVKRSQLNRVIP